MAGSIVKRDRPRAAPVNENVLNCAWQSTVGVGFPSRVQQKTAATHHASFRHTHATPAVDGSNNPRRR